MSPVWVTIPADREPEGLRLPVEFAEQNAGLGPRGPSLWIDAGSPHRARVDDHPTVADREARVAMAPTSERHLEPALTGEAHRRDYVGDAGAARDQPRPAVDRAVPDLALVVVVRIGLADDLSAK